MRQDKQAWDVAKSRLRARLDNRTYVLNPFRLNPKLHLYNYAMIRKEWAAYTYLLRNSRFLSAVGKTNVVTVNFPSDHPVRHLRVSIPELDSYSDKALRKFPDVDVLYDHLPKKVREYLDAWTEYDWRLKHEANKTRSHFSSCGDEVNTWGQLVRLWPSAIGLIPEEKRRRVLRQRNRSRLPKHIDHDENGEILNPSFKKEALEVTETIIAEALLLPECEDDPHPGVSYRKSP